MLLINEYDYLDIATVEKIAEQSMGYFFWKDKKCRYLGGNNTTREFMQVNSTQDLIGLTDLDFNWLEGGHTGWYFQQIDAKVMSGRMITNEKEILLKADPHGKIVTKVIITSKRALMRNGICIGVVLEAMNITDLIFPTLSSQPKPSKNILTERETDCIKFLLLGYSYKCIASKLGLSHRTVEYYIENIKDKLNCNNKQELIDKLLRLGYAPSYTNLMLERDPA